MRFISLIIFLLSISSSARAQGTFKSNDLMSNYPGRSTHFNLFVVGDSIMMASIGRYRVSAWTDYPRLLKSDSRGGNVQLFDLNSLNQDCPVGRGISWTNSIGYLRFSDTTTYDGYRNQATLSQCFSYHVYGSDSFLWKGEGSVYIPYSNGTQVTVASNSTFWIDNKLKKEFFALNELNGDTTLSIPYDSIAAQYPSRQGYSLSEFTVFSPFDSQSDSAYAFANFIKWNLNGNPIGIENFYSIVDLKDLNQLTTPKVWPSEITEVDVYGFGFIRDSTEFYPTTNIFKRTITSERLVDSLIDTVLVVDSLKYHPDTSRFPIYNRRYLIRNKGPFTLYAEEIEQYRDTLQFGLAAGQTVLLRLYKESEMLYEKSLITNDFTYDGDIRLENAFVLSDGRVIINLDIGSRGSGDRILFVDTNGANYLSLDENFLEVESARLEVLPNLADHEIQIKASSEIAELSIVDAMGREHKKTTPQVQQFYFNVEDLALGIYYIKGRLANGTIFSSKFIKK